MSVSVHVFVRKCNYWTDVEHEVKVAAQIIEKL